MATSAWKGAVEFGGFPLHVRLYPRVKSRSGESFKTLAPNGLPIHTVMKDTEGNEVTRDECSKGVEVGKDSYVALTPDAVESIASIEKSQSVEPKQFVPLDTVPLELAVQSYTVTPDKDVAGADKSVSILWNGLRSTEQAYVTQIAMRAGARDAIVVLYAKDDGLYAVALPFDAELHEPTTFSFEVDPKAEQLFAQFVGANYEQEQQDEFDHSALTSEWRQRRHAAIEAAASGKPMQMPEAPKTESTPDLMAALEAAVADTGAKGKGKSKPKSNGRKTTTRKTTKKAAAKA